MAREASSSFTCTQNPNCFVPTVKPTLETPQILENPRKDLHPARSMVPGLLLSWGLSPWTHQPLKPQPVNEEESKSEAWFLLPEPLENKPAGVPFQSSALAIPTGRRLHLRYHTYTFQKRNFLQLLTIYIRRTITQRLRDLRHATWLLWVSTSLIHKMGRYYLPLVLPNSSSCWEVQMRYCVWKSCWKQTFWANAEETVCVPWSLELCADLESEDWAGTGTAVRKNRENWTLLT